MFQKKFILGFISGFSFFGLFVVAFIIYSSLKIIPELEKLEQNLEISSDFMPKLEDSKIELINIKHEIRDSILFSNNKPKIINFWATWCKPCIIEMDSFDSLYSKTTDEVDFYFLSNEPIEKQKKMISEKGWKLPFYQYLDSNFTQLPHKELPTTYIIKNQIVYNKKIGKSNWYNPNVLDFLEGLK
jgi:thiol-disulfide isomerase/thioredoxin